MLKMLTSTRNRVTRSAILPGITSIGMRNEIHETITKRPANEHYRYAPLINIKHTGRELIRAEFHLSRRTDLAPPSRIK